MYRHLLYKHESVLDPFHLTLSQKANKLISQNRPFKFEYINAQLVRSQPQVQHRVFMCVLLQFFFLELELLLTFTQLFTFLVPTDDRRLSSKNLIPPSFTISTSVCVYMCVCSCACAICGLRFPHQGEWRAEGQRKGRRWWQERELLFSAAAFHESPSPARHHTNTPPSSGQHLHGWN